MTNSASAFVSTSPPAQGSKNGSRFLAIVICPLLAIVVADICEPIFGANDDVALAMIGAGFGIAVHPDPHLIFAHYGYGLILNFMSHLFADRAHGLLTLGALGFSIGILTRSILIDGTNGRWKAIVLLIVYAGAFAYALLCPQFTITSAILVSSGLSTRIVMLLKCRNSKFAIGASYLATVFGFLIRPISAVMTLGIAAPVWIWFVLRSSGNQRLQLIKFAAVIVGIAGLIYATDLVAYASSPAWAQARDYNYLRAMFSDFQRVPWHPEAAAYKAVGWSENDYQIFMSLYTVDPLFSSENISRVVNEVATTSPLFVTSEITHWFWYPANMPVLLGMLACQLSLYVLLKGDRVAFLLLTGEFLAILSSALTGRPPQSGVWFACAEATLIGLLALAGTQNMRRYEGSLRSRTVRMSFVALTISFAIFSGLQTARQHFAELSQARKYQASLKEGERLFEGKLVVWGGNLVWQWLVTATTAYPPVKSDPIIGLGVFATSPVGEATRRQAGVSNLSQTICHDRETRLVAGAAVMKYVDEFCFEHYGSRPAFSRVFQAGPTQIFAIALSDSAGPRNRAP